MGTQLTWGQCHTWGSFQPSLVPEFYGDVCCDPHMKGRQPCMYKEPPRRDDRLPVRCGSGTPGVNSAVTDLAGIPKKKPHSVQKASTMEGIVTLPGHFEERAYTPSVSALEILTHTSDTRRLPLPPRYYR